METKEDETQSFREKPKLMIVTPWFPPANGGVAMFADRLVRGLASLGFDGILVVAHSDRGEYSWSDRKLDPTVPGWRAVEGNVPYGWMLHTSTKARLGRYFRMPQALRACRKLFDETTPEVVILSYPSEMYWPFAHCIRQYGLRSMVVFHGSDAQGKPPESHAEIAFRKVVSSADAIIAVSKHLAERVGSALPLVGRRMRVIETGVDTDRFVPRPTSERPSNACTEILHVSNLNSVKRIDIILQAIAIASTRVRVKLTVVGGSGAKEQEAIRLAEELGIEGICTFVGISAETPKWFASADVFVLASESEGASLALLEAMSSGVPWISTPVGSALGAGEEMGGITVPVGDANALATAIVMLAEDPRKRAEYGSRARQFSVEHRSIHKMLDRYSSAIVATLETGSAERS